jgi:hypothetical protein
MPQLQENTLSTYTLTEEEQKSGSLLTHLNRCVIQNLMASTAEEKLNLVFDPLNPTLFAQQEASLAGMLSAYRYILEVDAALKQELSNQSGFQQE